MSADLRLSYDSLAIDAPIVHSDARVHGRLSTKCSPLVRTLYHHLSLLAS